MSVLFLHGRQSTPGGIKPTILAPYGHEVLKPALPDDDFDAAVRIAQAEFDRRKPDVVVGSSWGGAVAMNIDAGPIPLVLVSPAWKRWGTATKVKPDTFILQSPADDAVSIADSQELLRNSGLPETALIVVSTDQRRESMPRGRPLPPVIMPVWFSRICNTIFRFVFSRIFPLIVIIVGAYLLYDGARRVYYARESLAWPVAEGRIQESSVCPSHDSDSSDSSEVVYSFTVLGHTYSGNTVSFADYAAGNSSDPQGIVNRYPRNKFVSVRYLPSDPSICVLEPGLAGEAWSQSGGGLLFLVIGTIMAVGLPMLFHLEISNNGAVVATLIRFEMEWTGKRIMPS